MTQLYSSLVTYMNNTTYLCLVLAVLCSLVISRVRLALLHTALSFFSLLSLYSILYPSLASVPLFIDLRQQRRTNTWFQNKEFICMMEVGTSCFTIFGKDVSG